MLEYNINEGQEFLLLAQMAVKEKSNSKVSQHFQGQCLAARVILEMGSFQKEREHVKFMFIVLSIAREGKLTKAERRAANMGKLPHLSRHQHASVTVASSKVPTRKKRGSLGKYTMPKPHCFCIDMQKACHLIHSPTQNKDQLKP